MTRALLLPLLACALTACDQGRWIALPPLLMRCADLDDRNLKADLEDSSKFSLGRGMLQGVCNQSGAGNFTGDLRCSNDAVEVRCKS